MSSVNPNRLSVVWPPARPRARLMTPPAVALITLIKLLPTFKLSATNVRPVGRALRTMAAKSSSPARDCLELNQGRLRNRNDLSFNDIRTIVQDGRHDFQAHGIARRDVADAPDSSRGVVRRSAVAVAESNDTPGGSRLRTFISVAVPGPRLATAKEKVTCSLVGACRSLRTSVVQCPRVAK